MTAANGDDETPLIEGQSPKCTWEIHKVIVMVGIALLALLLFSTIIFGILLFDTYHQLLPSWNGPSNDNVNYYGRTAIASDNVRCSEIGRDVLLEGGNAVDSAIATIICLGVINPMSSGFGGGHFMTIYNATTGNCTAIDAREVAPYAATKNMFDKNPEEAQKGWKAMGIPGELHGLRTAYERFGGRVPWHRLFEPSIKMLNVGVPVSQALASSLKAERKTILAESTLSDFINPSTGDVYQFGDIMRSRTMLRDTLQYLANANDPIKEFYDGQMTDLFVAEFNENGAIITRDDFKNYTSIVYEQNDLIATDLNNHILYGPPPPSSSAITQSIVKIMDAYQDRFDQPAEAKIGESIIQYRLINSQPNDTFLVQTKYIEVRLSLQPNTN